MADGGIERKIGEKKANTALGYTTTVQILRIAQDYDGNIQFPNSRTSSYSYWLL